MARGFVEPRRNLRAKASPQASCSQALCKPGRCFPQGGPLLAPQHDAWHCLCLVLIVSMSLFVGAERSGIQTPKPGSCKAGYVCSASELLNLLTASHACPMSPSLPSGCTWGSTSSELLQVLLPKPQLLQTCLSLSTPFPGVSFLHGHRTRMFLRPILGSPLAPPAE